MSSGRSADWYGANQQYIYEQLNRVRLQLQSRVDASKEQPQQPPIPHPITPYTPGGLALDRLCHLFQLSPFERDLLLLCLGMELQPSFMGLCTALVGEGQRAPSFGMALGNLPGPNWQAITPDSPLRYWKILDLAPGQTLTSSGLRLDERILHALMGIDQIDQRLTAVLRSGLRSSTSNQTPLPPSHQDLVLQLTQQLQQPDQISPTSPLLHLYGSDPTTQQAIVSQACQMLDQGLLIIEAECLVTESGQLQLITHLLDREAMLNNSVLLLECGDLAETSQGSEAAPMQQQLNQAIAHLLDALTSPLILSSRERRRQQQRPMMAWEVPRPSATEQLHLWQQYAERSLGPVSLPALQPHLETLIAYFNLPPLAIQTAWMQAQKTVESLSPNPDPLADRLWSACLTQARPRMEELAQPIRSGVGWEDLVLPAKEMMVLRTIVAHVRQRARVYEQWGFAGKGGRGLGISALFSGQSGTGKTLAAEVLANALHLDLYRIDLSAVVSKYIGETEKNLRRIFDAAEAGGAILLFDEADALFGKRSEVKDSHDRYANLEVAYLLQRIEAYRGLAILTTNLKGSVDQAFLRRIRFIVQFPFPDAEQRAEIWRRVFPKETPIADLTYTKLAKLNVAGGNIRNIALNAAFLAADAGEAVQMKHILEASQSEYIKLERPLTDTEVRGWTTKDS